MVVKLEESTVKRLLADGRSDGADGYFPRSTSVLRKVRGERSVGSTYGQRALTIGAIKPLNYVGTAAHTENQLTPFKRLSRTAFAFETIMFGSKEDADKVLNYAQAMHKRVNGNLDWDIGSYKKGTSYSAFDAPLMLWTVACMADSVEVMYELLVGSLSQDEKSKMWDEWKLFGKLFGMQEADFPTTYGDFREYYAAELKDENNYLDRDAHRTGRFATFSIPSDAIRRPAMEVHNMLLLGSLPQEVRDLYGFSWSPFQQAAYKATGAAVRAARKVTPDSVAWGSAADLLYGPFVVERGRLAKGKSTPQGLGTHEGKHRQAALAA